MTLSGFTQEHEVKFAHRPMVSRYKIEDPKGKEIIWTDSFFAASVDRIATSVVSAYYMISLVSHPFSLLCNFHATR
jgi:hypothetical protein